MTLESRRGCDRAGDGDMAKRTRARGHCARRLTTPPFAVLKPLWIRRDAMKGGHDGEALVKGKPVAVQALAAGLGIEILKVDAVKVVWRWSNEKRERTSMLDDTGEAFRTGRVWRRLSGFERVR